jgi:hypothetical protein
VIDKIRRNKMTSIEMEKRLLVLEREIEIIKAKDKDKNTPWWHRRLGAFKDDPIYDEAMQLGREWRESQIPDYQVENTQK